MPRAGAQIIDAEIHGRAIKPAREVLLRGRGQDGSVELEKRFVDECGRRQRVAGSAAQPFAVRDAAQLGLRGAEQIGDRKLGRNTLAYGRHSETPMNAREC